MTWYPKWLAQEDISRHPIDNSWFLAWAHFTEEIFITFDNILESVLPPSYYKYAWITLAILVSVPPLVLIASVIIFSLR